MAAQPLKPHILIVDDREANRIAFRSLLAPDYTVTLAKSGPEALKICGQEQFAAILLDVRMPVMDGFETAEHLRGLGIWHTPILFMSAYDQSLLQVKRGYVAGATDFISSPVDEDLMKFKVAAYVKLYLRNESLRLQIESLNTLVQSLVSALQSRVPAEKVLKARIKELETAVEGVQRHMLPLGEPA